MRCGGRGENASGVFDCGTSEAFFYFRNGSEASRKKSPLKSNFDELFPDLIGLIVHKLKKINIDIRLTTFNKVKLQ